MRFNSTLSPLIWGLALFFFSFSAGAESSDGVLLVAEANQPPSMNSEDAPLTLFFQMGPLSMGQTSTQKTATPGENYPPDASFSQILFNGPVGFTTALGGWWKLSSDSAIGATTRIRWTTYKLQIDDKVLADTASDIMVMGTYKQNLMTNLQLEAGLGYHKLDGVFFRYTEGKASAELLNMSVHGIRLSGAISGNFDDVHYRVEVGETFGLLPAATTVGLETSYKLPEPVSNLFPVYVGVQYQFAYRDMTAETTRTEVSVGGTEHMLALTVGGTFDLFGGASAPAPEPEEVLPEEEGSLDL